MSEVRELPTYKLGYAIEQENRPALMAGGMEPRELLARAARGLADVPKFNVDTHPFTLFDPLDQEQQGACQGHALALIFAICYWLCTGQVLHFSRAAAYYLSQRRDGIRGDNGSTLSGGQWVATVHGLCLEEHWPYPDRYDPTEPRGIQYPFKLVSAQPTDDPGLVREALDMGLMVQDGIGWNGSVSRTLVTNYVGGGGGHSTVLWTKKGPNYRRLNSWGMWDGDGCNENTPEALDQQVRWRGNTHVIYAPEQMIYPAPLPV